MKQFIQKYLKDHETAWAPSTLKSETSRLNANADLLDKTPENAYRAMVRAGAKPYAIKTMFIRIVALEEWCLSEGLVNGHPFKDFMEKHNNRFKHAYVKENVEISYEDAVAKIKTLEEPFRSQALGMLKTGVRISEAGAVKNGKVIGKGGKQRSVYGTIDEVAPKSTFWRKLSSIGLKPHTLRKLCVSKLVDAGATPADLCAIFGWTSIATAYNYMQAKNDKRLGELVQEATKEA